MHQDTLSKKSQRVYAVIIDVDFDILEQILVDARSSAYGEIKVILQRHGFKQQQGNFYFGGEHIDAVGCVLAVQDLAKQLPWFRASVRSLKMLRIEEVNDLLPAISERV